MASNPTISKLDTGQAFMRCYTEADDALRTIVASATAFEIELSAVDGDSTLAIGTTDGTVSGTQKVLKTNTSGELKVEPKDVSATAAITSASTGEVLAPVASVGIKSLALYVKTTATIVGPQLLTLEVSPADSGDVWVATTATVLPSLTAGVVVISSVIAVAARRFRVTIAAAITSGTADVYVVGQA